MSEVPLYKGLSRTGISSTSPLVQFVPLERDTTRAENAQGTPTQSRVSPSIPACEDKNRCVGDVTGVSHPQSVSDRVCRTQCIYQLDLESQLPSKTVNLDLN